MTNARDLDEIDGEFRRLHDQVNIMAHEIAVGLNREKQLKAELDAANDNVATLKKQMALDFETISKQKLEIRQLKEAVFVLENL